MPQGGIRGLLEDEAGLVMHVHGLRRPQCIYCLLSWIGMAPAGPKVLVQKMAGIKSTDVLMVRVFISTRAARITLRARHTGFPSRSIRILAANWTHVVPPISTIGFLRHDVSLGVDLLHHAVLIR